MGIGGFWATEAEAEAFFEKLEKKSKEKQKKVKLPARGFETRISVWKAGPLTIRPRNFLLKRRKSIKTNLSKFFQIIVKKRLSVPSY